MALPPPPLSDHFPPRKGRGHEVCGPAATSFAAILCGMNDGPALWVSEAWQPEAVNPLGLARFCDPQKLVLARPQNHMDALATAEEALRSGAVSVVVCELTKPLDLRQGRRLNLAAEAGGATGIFLIPEGMGSNAAQTRWQCAPLFDVVLFDGGDSTLQRWELIKNKAGTLSAWTLRWNAEKRRIIVVPETGE